MAAPAFSQWFTQWQWSWIGVVLVTLLGGGYLWAWLRGHSRAGIGTARLALVLLACGLLLYITCGPVGVYAHTYLWMFALRMGLLDAVVPLGLALGKPLDLIGAALGSDLRHRPAGSRVLRFLTFPAVSSILGTSSLLAVFWTGYGQAAATNGFIDALLVVHLLVVGTLVMLPLLTDDLLPSWAGPGMRTLLACLDGLLDALPGILVMTAGSLLMPRFPGFSVAGRGSFDAALDQKYAGGALLAVAESIGIPMLIAVFVEWMRQDARNAVETDRRLDALDDEGELTTPWWVQTPERDER